MDVGDAGLKALDSDWGSQHKIHLVLTFIVWMGLEWWLTRAPVGEEQIKGLLCLHPVCHLPTVNPSLLVSRYSVDPISLESLS